MHHFERNIGRLDAGIRYTLAAILFGVSLRFNADPVVSLVSALLAIVLAATAISGRCPTYRLLRVNTSSERLTHLR